MKYQCAHRWAFKAWGGELEQIEVDLPAISGHEVTVRVTHCGICMFRPGALTWGAGRCPPLRPVARSCRSRWAMK